MNSPISKIPKPTFFNRIPSFLWIFIIVGGMILFIGGIITFFVALGTVEGFGSLVILILAIIAIIAAKPEYKKIKTPIDSFTIGAGVFFIALMATCIDQTGNVIYNKPLEIIYCPQNTTLLRESDISHPLPGRTDITQDFSCIHNETGKTEYVINPFQMLLVRFVEYVFFVYAVMGIIKLKFRLMKRRSL